MNNRRHFIQSAAASVAAPFILPSRVWSQSANGKIRMGFIGLGKQMGGLIGKFLQYPEVEVVAVCDVYDVRRDLYKKRVDDHYAKNGGAGKPCETTGDFRQITERADIDAVCIATPDHWHAIITNSALSHGKDVYCEKPLTHNIHEAVSVVETVKKHNRVLQTGSMQRSSKEFRIACEL
ncbi:MAG: Gfo/Idh/MocA family oxidoreductase, partial [Bryobacterales bacterium]|nr:Gfo/Idh/MocA family oxidoreductase [Bryobacterales bacterium]